jgi:hypothetical protein
MENEALCQAVVNHVTYTCVKLVCEKMLESVKALATQQRAFNEEQTQAEIVATKNAINASIASWALSHPQAKEVVGILAIDTTESVVKLFQSKIMMSTLTGGVEGGVRFLEHALEKSNLALNNE